MELPNIGRIASVCTSTLNVEDAAGLEVAMLQRKREENLNGKLFFWGKIYGTTQDYLVIYSLDSSKDFPEKKYYFWYLHYYYIFVMINF